MKLERTREEPFRIAVWGPGDVGSICIREAQRLPEFDVVAAYVYSEQKDGEDIGTLAGVDPTGVMATRDVDRFLAVECDVVLYTALDFPGSGALEDFVTLLEAGKNVITSHPYNYLDVREAEFGAAIAAAAERGGSTFYAGGVNPDFIGHRLSLLLTGLSNDVEQIKIEEYFDCVLQANPSTLQIIGLGGDPDQAMDENSPALFYQKQYWFQMIEHMAAELGVELSRVEASALSEPAPEDLHSPVMTIEKGRTGRVSYESVGYVGDVPFITMKVGWYLTGLMRPEGVTSDTQWIISTEGRPSTRVVLDVEPSVLGDRTELDREPAAPGYVAFGICMMQSIPAVVAHKPGIKPTDLPPVHWRSDQRLAPLGAHADGQSSTHVEHLAVDVVGSG